MVNVNKFCTECSCVSCVNDSEACTRLLVATHGIDVNAQDDNGNTPLHIAIEHQLARCVEILISAGADVCLRSDSGEEPVSLLAKRLPDTMTYLLNECVFVDQYDPSNDKCVLKVDFSPIVGYPEFRATDGKASSLASSSHDGLHMSWQKEMRLLTSLLQSPITAWGSKILTHPVVQIFIEQKWKRVRKYFWLAILFYIFYVILYTSYIIDVYLVRCPCRLFTRRMLNAGANEGAVHNSTSGPAGVSPETLQVPSPTASQCEIATGINSEVALILVSTMLLAAIELCKLVITPKLYLRGWINYGTWIFIGLVLTTTVPNLNKQMSIGAYQYQAAALTVFLAWAFILHQISRFPSLGKYIEMFGAVLKSFGFFLLTFMSLFIAFALSFSILFPTNSAFTFFCYSVLKVFVMMVGEIDYQDMFYGDGTSVTGPLLGHLLYAAFVLVVSIVLMNLVIGLTVKDIQELQEQGELRRTAKLILSIYHLESFIFSRRIPRQLGDYLKASISVLYPTKHGREGLTFAFLPNSRKDRTIPDYLKQAALILASISYEKFRSQRCSKLFTMSTTDGLGGVNGVSGAIGVSDSHGGIVVGVDHHQQPSYYSSSSSSPSSFKSSSLEAHSLDVPVIGGGRGNLGARKNSSVMTAPAWTSSSSQR
ncbi:unnamed protein product [Orchesella dallaii]|uniref:Ion transport domain-containing protein n=1 Tax=Orchesella dallaii TaxID=48710 RepID=A0ABP1PWA4_9HEXA